MKDSLFHKLPEIRYLESAILHFKYSKKCRGWRKKLKCLLNIFLIEKFPSSCTLASQVGNKKLKKPNLKASPETDSNNVI